MSKKILLLSVFLMTAAVSGVPVPGYLVTGEKPSRLEVRAESELQLFWQKIFGRKLIKISEQQSRGKSVVYLGRTKYAEQNKINCSKLDEEEWVLKTSGDDLIIAGGRPAGVLYGVYEMLEQLGVEFLAFDETLIPAPCRKIPVFNEKRKPAFVGRVIFDSIPDVMQRTGHKYSVWATPEVIESYKLWVLRRRINGNNCKSVYPYYVGRVFNLCHWPEWHTMSLYVNPKLYDSHPEYFAMNSSGERVRPGSFTMRGDICMSNPEVRRHALNSLRQMIKKDRSRRGPDEWSTVYDVTRLDASPYFCQCENCRKIAAYDGSDTGLYVDFANYIAKNIRKEYPDIIIRIQAHATGGRKPPRKIIPEKNILFRLCDTFTTRDPFRSIEKVRDPEALQYFRDWTKFGTPHVKMCWDYWNLSGVYFDPPRIETVFDALKPDFKYFLRHGINALFIEAEIDGHKPQNFMMLNYYVAGKLLVDPDKDPERSAQIFIENYYGKTAAPIMYKYFKLIREGVAKDPQKASTHIVGEWQFATADFMLSMYNDFKAAAAATGDSRRKQRINSELIAPIWAVLARWPNFEEKFAKAGINRKQLICECKTLVRNNIRRYACEKPEKSDKLFEQKFKEIEILPVVPREFSHISRHNIRIANHSYFRPDKSLNCSIVRDPESIQGLVLKSASKNPASHGVNKVMPGKYRFRTTAFHMASNKKRISLFLKKVPEDEKYHWYRIPGKIVLGIRSNFWGHGWGINARTNTWYTLTYGDDKDNTWEQIWFRAKFTGPAYVKGSTKENAIFIDTVVAVRSDGIKVDL